MNTKINKKLPPYTDINAQHSSRKVRKRDAKSAKFF
jgi:hypothetical protein